MSTLASMVRKAASPVLVSMAVLLTVTVPAQAAGLIGDQVNVSLIAPNDFGGVNATDAGLLVGAGAEISPQIDPSNIGGGSGWLLTGATASEFIDLDAFTITLRLLNGDPNGAGTGWTSGAKYVFAGLDIAGFTITGVAGSSTGISNFDSNWINLDSAHQISFELDQILFNPVTGETRYGDVVLTLSVQAEPDNRTPEPGTLALAGLALAVASALRRRSGFRA